MIFIISVSWCSSISFILLLLAWIPHDADSLSAYQVKDDEEDKMGDSTYTLYSYEHGRYSMRFQLD